MDRRAASLGIDTDGLIKTEEQIAQEQQQAMMMQMAQQYGPQVVDAAAQGVLQNQQIQAQAQAPQEG